MVDVGVLLRDQGKAHEAQPFLVGAYERSRHFTGQNRYGHLKAMHELAVLMVDTGQLEKARTLATTGLQRARQMAQESDESVLFGIPAVELLIAANQLVLADVAKRSGQLQEAESHATDAVIRFEQLRRPGHFDRLIATMELAAVLIEQGRDTEAMALLEPIEAPMRSRVNGGQLRHLARLSSRIGAIDLRRGRLADAEKRLLEANQLFEQLATSRSGDVEYAVAQMKALRDRRPESAPTTADHMTSR